MVGNRRRKKALLDNMIIDEKTIREALEKGERVTLECKQARSEVPKELWNTRYCGEACVRHWDGSVKVVAK